MRREGEILHYGTDADPAEVAGSVQVGEIETKENNDSDSEKVETIRRTVSQWTQAWLNKFYDSPPAHEEINSHKYNIWLVGIIDQLTHTENDKRVFAPAYQAGAEVFYEELVTFAEQKVTEDANSPKLQQFFKNIHQAFFSSTGGLSEYMDVAYHLLFTAKTNRVPELQDWFGQQFTSEMVYNLTFCDDETIRHLVEQVKARPVAELLDVIDQLRAIAVRALFDSYSEEAGYNNIIKIIQALRESCQSPLVTYAADDALEKLDREQNNFSDETNVDGTVGVGLQPSQALLNKYHEDSRHLKMQIKPDLKVTGSNILTPISKDVVGIFDSNNFLYAIGRVDFSSLEEAVKVSPLAIEEIRNFLKDKKHPLPGEIRNLLSVIVRNVIGPRQGEYPVLAEGLPDYLYSISQVLTVEEYKELTAQIIAKEKQEDSQRMYKSQITQEYDKKNSEASQDFLRKFEILLPQLIEVLPIEFSWAKRKLEQYNKHQLNNEKDFAFKRAIECINRIEDSIRNDLGIRNGLDAFSDYNSVRQLPFDNKVLTDLKGGQWLSEAILLVENLLKVRKDLEDSHRQNLYEWKEKGSLSFYGDNKTEYLEQMSAYKNSMKRFASHYSQFSRHLTKYLKQVEKEQSDQLVPVHCTRISELAKDKKLMPFEATDAQDVPILLADLHRPALRARVEEDLGVSLTELTLSSQIQFLRFLAGQNKEGYEKLKSVLNRSKGFRAELLNSFLVVSEDTAYGHYLLELAERLTGKPDIAKRVFETCNQFLKKAQDKAGEILVELQTEFPELGLTADVVILALLSRAKDFLMELNQQADAGKPLPKLVNEFVAELSQGTLQDQMIRAHFKSVAELLNGNNIHLDQLEQRQSLVIKSLLKNPEQKGIMLSALARMGKLEPIPEIHWRVDRSLEEYNLRLGIDLAGFLREKAEEKPHQKLLEIGPGSGSSKKERAEAGLGDLFNELALSDKIYYPLAPVIEKLLDFDKLQAEIGRELTMQDRQLLADFIYKTIVIEPGQTERDNFDYDGQNTTYLKRDINALKKILPEVGNYLKTVTAVPSQISTHNKQAQVIYPYKIRVAEQSREFQQAKQLVDKNLVGYLKNGWEEIDYHSLIEAFPPNVMIGEFKDIRRLSPDQIDVELAVRSTVYERGEEYVKFLTTLLSKLAKNGVAIDDSIRDNDGWYYRIAEVWEAKKRMSGVNPEILVVLGPGFAGEDHRQDLVPLAMLATKDGSSKELAAKYLQPGYQLVNLEDLANDAKYLNSLDKTGWTASCVQEALTFKEIIGIAA